LIEHPGVQQFLEKNYTGAGESLASRDISNSELLDEISKLQSAFIAQLNDARARLEESCRFYMFKLDAITPHSTLDEFKDLTSHLSRVIESLRSEILMCQNQIDLATTGKGFVQKSVQEFTLGFKGALRTRIARELGL
jgi:hypothetical protein